MIIGIGTDLVKIERIKRVLGRRGDKFARRILTAPEYAVFANHDRHQAGFLAKRFAAKEALSKALKTGIGQISWQDIEVKNSPAGAPTLDLSGRAREILLEQGGRGVHLSLSDEGDYALAFVVVSG